jgi:hypothetical protein
VKGDGLTHTQVRQLSHWAWDLARDDELQIAVFAATGMALGGIEAGGDQGVFAKRFDGVDMGLNDKGG